MVTFLPQKQRKCVFYENDSTRNWPCCQSRPHLLHLATLDCSASLESQAVRIV